MSGFDYLVSVSVTAKDAKPGERRWRTFAGEVSPVRSVPPSDSRYGLDAITAALKEAAVAAEGEAATP